MIAPGGIDAFIDLFGPDYVQLAVDLGIRRDRIETTIAFDKAAELGTKGGRKRHRVNDRCPHRDRWARRVQDAFAQLEQRHTHGKIVLIP